MITAGTRKRLPLADIADCYEAIPHDRLVSAIEERVSDRHLLKLVRAMLRAGVMERAGGPGSVGLIVVIALWIVWCAGVATVFWWFGRRQ